jgi:RecB family exonuclease
MKLEKLSATAMEVAESCMSRFVANTKAGYGGEQKNDAAMMGTTCHFALEEFVKRFVQNWSPENQTLANLVILMDAGFIQTFGRLDKRDPKYKDCLDMVTRWFERNREWGGFRVLSTEQKLNFKVKTSAGEIPFNFIIDRLDYLGDGVYRVVDYKTLARPLSADAVQDKLQALIYAMAVAIQFKDDPNPPVKIWVVFDMLRWEGPVGGVFFREDLVDTWGRIKAVCEKIIATDEEKAPETINDACGFCVKKSTCGAVAKNVAAGGVQSLPDIESKINQRALLHMQKAAIMRALDELDSVIIAEMKNNDEIKHPTDLIDATLKFRSTRSIDPEAVLKTVGPDVFARYGKEGAIELPLKALDALLKDPTVDPEARAHIESLIVRDYADEPYLETKKKAVRRTK